MSPERALVVTLDLRRGEARREEVPRPFLDREGTVERQAPKRPDILAGLAPPLSARLYRTATAYRVLQLTEGETYRR